MLKLFVCLKEIFETRLYYLVLDTISGCLLICNSSSKAGGQVPVYYKITDGTHIRKTPMKKLFAHVKTKAELTEYLASKTLEKGRQSGKCVVVAWSCRCEATHMDASASSK